MAHDPKSYWRSFEPREPVTTLRDLLDVIEGVGKSAPLVVWRGVSDETWALHSSLYRYAANTLGGSPTETQVSNVERWTIEQARSWSLDRVPGPRSGLELVAWLQHTGSPTRLIDVTLNPLVAAWFACELSDGISNADGRLFAIAISSPLLVDDGAREPPWVDSAASNYEALTSSSTLLWIPPPVDPRISAQSGAFLVGPLPTTSGGQWYNKGAASDRYTAAEVRALTSIPIRAYTSVVPGTTYRRNPLISVRIAAACKQDLREQLERVFNLSSRLLFPDPYGLAGYLRRARPPG